MNLKQLFLPLAIMASPLCAEATTLRIFDDVLFYDGYLVENHPEKDVDDGILRHTTSCYAVPLTSEQIAQIGTQLSMNVWVKACCDNYDRIGNINLALVPKGAKTYRTGDVQRLEIGRFITPFMDKNKMPNTVPYSYEVDFLSPIFRDAKLLEDYDIWVEFELFGVPYAANQQISGCQDRNDVFRGTLEFETNEPAPLTDNNVLVPIVMKKPEYIGGNLNNYSEAGTDMIGKTQKTYTFEVPCDVEDAQLVLITSNHGANSGGEEYNRRWHLVYWDGAMQPTLMYMPGRTSCEPFRMYNTQSNGIYGLSKKTDAQWQSFSNWCPGDVIDNRIINLGAVKAGKHKVQIRVPDAKFADNQGDIPVSIFFQGAKTGSIPAPSGVEGVLLPDALDVYARVEGSVIRMYTNDPIDMVEVHDLGGNLLHKQFNASPVPVDSLGSGYCLLSAHCADGRIQTLKIKL